MFVREESRRVIEIFFAYASEDKTLRNKIEKHLSLLKQQDIITTWYDDSVGAGKERELEINIRLNTAHIILLLVSADFLASPHCCSLMERALERQEAKAARVIPILLRPVDWENAQFRKLQVLPTNSIPITSWRSLDEAC